MDEENVMDFKTLRAKFQEEEEMLLKQTPRPKPALPEKPRVVPPPQSPTHYMPAGARPSLLTSINQSLESKTTLAPRVVFKDEKKDSKKPLLLTNSKTKDTKIKVGKEKSKGGRERLYDEDVPEQKPKKENKDKKKEATAELVPATPPPKNSTLKKKGFLGFKKSKRDSTEVPSEPILDSPSSEVSGPVPLIPVPQDFSSPNPDIQTPSKALMPETPILPSSNPAAVIPPLSSTTPDFTPQQVFFPEVPASPVAPSLEDESTTPTETLHVPRPASQNEVLPSHTPPLIIPEPDMSMLAPPHSTPSPDPGPTEEQVELETLEIPPPPEDLNLGSVSPKLERPLSALSALERAAEMSPGKKTPPGDQRIFNALEKARRMAHNHQKSASPLTVTPPSEEGVPDGPTLYNLPPIDYEGGKGLPPKPEVNGLDHRSSLVLEGIAEEDVPVKPVMPPPPPPRKQLSDPEIISAAPQKPAGQPSVDFSAFNPLAPLEDNAVAIPAPAEFIEPDADIGAHTNVLEFETPEAHSPDLPLSDWGSESPDGPHPPQLLPNGTIPTGGVLPTTPAFDHDIPESLSNRNSVISVPGSLSNRDSVISVPGSLSNRDSVISVPGSLSNRDSVISVPGSLSNRDSVISVPGGDGNPYEATENVYENVSASSKKKGKNDGKKRKGPPKNPYAETAEKTEEKTKTGRFGKGDKKAAAAAVAAEGPDEKELKKKEKQRLEKEKKELKERQEREKKEQKEREKRENELKKKFKITGQEDAMYQATVTVTSKGRKDDLPVKSGDTISIIRTTNCPKGKWLARDSSNNYGYIAVNHVDLDIKEMLELGKKAAVSRMNSTSVEPEITSSGSRASNHYPNESFTDDSEEWTCDDDEPLSPTENVEPQLPTVHTRTHSMPAMGDTGREELTFNHQHSHSDLVEGPHLQARNEALQKLATFFHPPKSTEPTASPEPVTTPEAITEEEEEEEEEAPMPESSPSQLLDFEIPIIPPPEQYADFSE